MHKREYVNLVEQKLKESVSDLDVSNFATQSAVNVFKGNGGTDWDAYAEGLRLNKEEVKLGLSGIPTSIVVDGYQVIFDKTEELVKSQITDPNATIYDEGGDGHQTYYYAVIEAPRTNNSEQ